MGYKKINDNILFSTADAIRAKLGTGTFYKPHEFASAIMSIQGEPNIEQLSISANGVFSATSDVDGFNPVVVQVPNTYSLADEGKVVSNASLISQASLGISANGTYDTTATNEVVVNVEGADTSDATLSSGSQMLSGITAYARSSKYTGTIPMYNGSIDGGSGSVPSYDYYSGSYTIVPSTVSQAFPTAGKIMSENLQVEAYSAGSIPDTYSGSYVITPSMISQAFPTAGKLMSQDLTVEAYSLDYYSGSYIITPSTDAIILSVYGKTMNGNLQINGYSASERAYQGSYVVEPSTTVQILSTSGKVMTSDLQILSTSTINDGDKITLKMGFALSDSTFLSFQASDHLSVIGMGAFQSARNLLNASFDFCQTIEINAFTNCVNLSDISFPVCKNVGSDAFNGCTALKSVDMPSLYTAYMNAFNGCTSLANVSAPQLYRASDSAFQSCALESAYFPNLAQVYYCAFKDCIALSTISMPNLYEIGNQAFKGCTLLSSIYMMSVYMVSLYYSETFDDTPYSHNDSLYAKIYVPSALVSEYQADSVWSHFSNCFVGI